MVHVLILGFYPLSGTALGGTGHAESTFRGEVSDVPQHEGREKVLTGGVMGYGEDGRTYSFRSCLAVCRFPSAAERMRMRGTVRGMREMSV